MKPEKYFPYLYKFDLMSFMHSDCILKRNGMLCGAELNSTSSKKIIYVGYEEFFCCQYVLNLIHQGIFSYRGQDGNRLFEQTIPFLDLGMCSVRHGGMVYPSSILRHVKISKEMLADFVKYIFYVYLPSQNISKSSIYSLIIFLKNDEHCEEINGLL